MVDLLEYCTMVHVRVLLEYATVRANALVQAAARLLQYCNTVGEIVAESAVVCWVGCLDMPICLVTKVGLSLMHMSACLRGAFEVILLLIKITTR